ncbi:MAG: hypothetical protein JXB26_10405 [Candidatus Aminicenantes bacterium]|nr:hypothetical protein [Candidatus Aminicenantes bacterium]
MIINKKRSKYSNTFAFILRPVLLFILCLFLSGQEIIPARDEKIPLLRLMNISPPAESVAFLQSKVPPLLRNLPTEQNHPKTEHFSLQVEKNGEEALNMLLEVDKNSFERLETLSRENEIWEPMITSVEEALINYDKIVIYGSESSGRMAKLIERSLWRSFWNRVKSQKKIWSKLEPHLAHPIEDQFLGETAGGDAALFFLFPEFDDVQLIGKLQYLERGIKKEDVVICLSDDGTSSPVLGAALAALESWKSGGNFDPQESQKKIFFFAANPESSLLPLDSCRKVLQEPGLTKIFLTTGPQAIAGLTRMQVASIELYVLGNILRTALYRVLQRFLSKREMEKLGFAKEPRPEKEWNSFFSLLQEIRKKTDLISQISEMEVQAYDYQRNIDYFCGEGLMAVLIDVTERALFFPRPLFDTDSSSSGTRRVRLFTEASGSQPVRLSLLGRPFRGISEHFYRKPLEEELQNPALREKIRNNLQIAEHSPLPANNFSFSEFLRQEQNPDPKSTAIIFCLGEEFEELKNTNSGFRKFLDMCLSRDSKVALVVISDNPEKDIKKTTEKIPGFEKNGKHLLVTIKTGEDDPLDLRKIFALKIILNGHSTSILSRLDRMIGNSPYYFQPRNLKLIGRATELVRVTVNDILSHPNWVKRYGVKNPVFYGEANAVLFEAIHYLNERGFGSSSEIAIAIIRILESLRLKKAVMQKTAMDLAEEPGLKRYLTAIISDNQKIPPKKNDPLMVR